MGRTIFVKLVFPYLDAKVSRIMKIVVEEDVLSG